MTDATSAMLAYSSWEIWLTLLVTAFIGTTLPRASFFVLGSRVTLPSALLRALRYSPAAALAAVVAPDVLLSGGSIAPLNPKVAALVVVILVASRWRNPWLPFIAGMGTLWGLQALVG